MQRAGGLERTLPGVQVDEVEQVDRGDTPVPVPVGERNGATQTSKFRVMRLEGATTR